MISNATMRAMSDVASRERDVLQSYASGATAERGDVAQTAGSNFTLDPLCAAPPADAYFITSDERGKMLFTRDGAFALKDGALVDQAGRPILGYGNNESTLQPLRADPVDEALGLVANARIETTGEVTYERATVDPRTGKRGMQRAALGSIALARFTPGTKLQVVDSQHAAAPSGIMPHIGKPGDGNFATITPFARANSGIDIDLSLQRLQEAYLALDALRAAGKAKAGVEKTAMDLLK